MLHFWSIVRDVTFVATWLGIPIIAFLPRLKNPHDLGRRVVIGALVTWIALLLHLQFIHLPVAQAIADARGNSGYDGAAVSAFTLLFGWVLGLIGSGLAACGYMVFRNLREKRRERRRT